MSLPARIVLASGNQGKIREIATLFSDLGVHIIPQAELNVESPPETGATFVANALLKARHAATQTGLPAMADDSGLCVDALDGAPGIFSARYAGESANDEQNLDKVLEALRETADADRGAGFHCAAVLVFADEASDPLIAEATWRGTLLRQRAGAGGFGYDPIFYDAALGQTGAQMSREQKNDISHRGKAFRELKALLESRVI